MRKLLGRVMSGSLTDGFVMRVEPHISLDELKTGKFVSIVGSKNSFFSLITDLELHVSHPDILLFPPSETETLLKEFLREKDMYASVQLRPMIMIDEHKKPLPVKTIPTHFTPVYEATRADVALIFGDEQQEPKKYFNIGFPLDMHTPVCINMERLVERSNGIFGKTGTGKTFLTRLVLSGLIYNNKATNLIFDMHSEYGLQARSENKNQPFVKGLKTLFGQKIALFSLDPQSTRRRGCTPDVSIVLQYQSIQVEDIIGLHEELNLHPTALEAMYLIAARYKENWLHELLAHESTIKEFAQSLGAHPESMAALCRKLKRIERFPFIINQSNEYACPITQMIEYLKQGINVIVEFGNHNTTFCYLLIANIITRRIHSEYIKWTEKFLGSQNPTDRPHPLMITIEEAHKFLNTQTARQTIFGTIAREMRKYYVSLLIIDQRPSGIDQEILSQIGTKIIAQLNDEKDIQAVLTGTANAHYLRSIISTLDSKKQVLLIGHATTMPIVVQTREYDEVFYQTMQSSLTNISTTQLIEELF